MALPKEQNPSWQNVLSASGLSGKSVTSLNAYKLGSVYVLEVGYSGGTAYIKHKQGIFEFGGTADWDSGTKCSG